MLNYCFCFARSFHVESLIHSFDARLLCDLRSSSLLRLYIVCRLRGGCLPPPSHHTPLCSSFLSTTFARSTHENERLRIVYLCRVCSSVFFHSIDW